MPTETNLPVKCLMWLEMSFQLIDKSIEFDSQSQESRMLMAFAEECFLKARTEIEKVEE